MAIRFFHQGSSKFPDRERNAILESFRSSQFYDPFATGAQVITTVNFNGEDYIFGNSATAGQFKEFIATRGMKTNFLPSPTSDVNQRVQIREQLPDDNKAQLRALVPFIFTGLALIFIFRS